MLIPPLAKILIVFAGILLLSRFKIHLGVALILGGVVLDVWSGRNDMILSDALHALGDPALWLLLIVTALILDIGRFVSKDDHAAVLLNAAQRWGGRHGRAFSIMAVPSVIGFVPMPGGALVSAPLVQKTVHEESWSPGWKVAVNYWFRHTWEYWWPLFPVVIVSLSIFEIQPWRFILANSVYSLVAFVAGYVFLVRPHLAALQQTASVEQRTEGRLFPILFPLVLVAIVTVALPPFLVRALPGVDATLRREL